MSQFASVTHGDWIAAPPDLVRAQFADLQHHIDAGVHAKLSFQPLPPRDGCARYEQVVRLLGLTQRDVFERRFDADGTMTDTSVEGFNRGGSLQARFRPGFRNGRSGTEVTVTVRLPLPPLVGSLLRPLLEAQVRREVRVALAEDKNDLEVRGYRRAPLPAAA